MKIPHKKTDVETAEKTNKENGERADYSAIARQALRVPGGDGGLRVDQGLVRLWPRHSRSRLQNWIREGRVRVDSAVITEPKHKLWGGELVELEEALDELETCKPLQELMGERFVRAYVSVKRKEYETFFRVISSWEREFLLLNV